MIHPTYHPYLFFSCDKIIAKRFYYVFLFIMLCHIESFLTSILGTFPMMNPWAVNNLKEFLYYCCPECEEKVKSLDIFLQHALNQHALAKEILPKIIVKEEFDEQYNDDFDTVSHFSPVL